MTDKIKSAIQYGDDYYKDLISACCDISDRHKEYIKMANNSLKAWEEVLTELENMRDIIWQDTDNNARIVRANAWDKIEILNKVIEIINQKLAEIEE